MNHNFNVIRRHRNPLILLNLVFIVATVLSATVLASIFSPPVWKATAKFNVPNSGGNLSADIGGGTFSEGDTGYSKEVNPLQIQSTIITSDAVMGKVLAIDPEKEAFPLLKPFKVLFSVEPQPQSTVMLLEARGPSTELALTRARNLSKVYQQRLNELRSSDANFRQEFSQEELKQSKDRLLGAQQELAEFRRTTGIVDIENQKQELNSSISELRTKLTLLQSEAEASQARADIAASQFNTTPERAIQSLNLAENQEYQEVRQKLAQTEIELTEARGKYKDSSPQIQNLLTRREQLTQELNQRVSSAIPNTNLKEIDITLGGNSSTKRLDMISELIASQTTTQGLQQQTNQIQNQINILTNELNTISANEGELRSLELKRSNAEGVYKGIVAKINKVKIDNFNSYPNVQLIDGPNLDPMPEEPSKKLILLGGIMASMFGSAGLLIFLESSSPLLSPKDLILLDYPILFSIGNLKQPYLRWDSVDNKLLKPSFENEFSRDSFRSKDYDESYLPIYKDQALQGKEKLIDDWQCHDLTEREFERLATNFRSLELENGRVMITSAKSGEGKTTITLGLAVALKKLGFHVLVVDGDLQRASLSKHINVMPEQRETRDLEIPPTINLSRGLDFIPAPLLPKEKTAEFLAKGNFEKYLNQVQTEGNYDYVLVDTSPVHLTSESMLMAPIVENVLFVVRPGTSDRNSVVDSLEQLKLHRVQIKGLILNGVDSSNNSYRYSYYKPQLPQALVAQEAVANYDSNYN